MAQIGRKNGDVGLALALARGLSVKDAARQAGISERVARKHYLQITDDHFEEAVRGARSIFVASTAPQGVVNEKCDTLETARTSKVSPCVALSMGSTGFEPARDLTPTRPSTWRVCQFRHEPARL